MPRPSSFKKGLRVHDSWWPWKVGSVVRVTKTRVHVKWGEGDISSYDKAHQQFLRVE